MSGQVKICPVVLRDQGCELLMFLNPKVGLQLVSGTLKSNETIFGAASRELYEETGLRAGRMALIGEANIAGARWIFVRCDSVGFGEVWEWHTLNDPGQNFVFFWHDLMSSPPPNCAAPFQAAINLIRNEVRYKGLT